MFRNVQFERRWEGGVSFAFEIVKALWIVGFFLVALDLMSETGNFSNFFVGEFFKFSLQNESVFKSRVHFGLEFIGNLKFSRLLCDFFVQQSVFLRNAYYFIFVFIYFSLIILYSLLIAHILLFYHPFVPYVRVLYLYLSTLTSFSKLVILSHNCSIIFFSLALSSA